MNHQQILNNKQFLKDAVNHLKTHAVETSPSVFEYADPADWEAEVILRNIISKIAANKRNVSGPELIEWLRGECDFRKVPTTDSAMIIILRELPDIEVWVNTIRHQRGKE